MVQLETLVEVKGDLCSANGRRTDTRNAVKRRLRSFSAVRRPSVGKCTEAPCCTAVSSTFAKWPA